MYNFFDTPCTGCLTLFKNRKLHKRIKVNYRVTFKQLLWFSCFKVHASLYMIRPTTTEKFVFYCFKHLWNPVCMFNLSGCFSIIRQTIEAYIENETEFFFSVWVQIDPNLGNLKRGGGCLPFCVQNVYTDLNFERSWFLFHFCKLNILTCNKNYMYLSFFINTNMYISAWFAINIKKKRADACMMIACLARCANHRHLLEFDQKLVFCAGMWFTIVFCIMHYKIKLLNHTKITHGTLITAPFWKVYSTWST